MSADVRTIDMQNLPDAIRIMNESSQGMSFEWHLDLFTFLALFRYWNFSHEHSLIGYVDGEPAALVINCADPETLEAYTVYWGALSKFRTGRISLVLFNQACKKLREDGYVLLHGVSVPDRPVRRYRFISAQPEYALVDMQAESVHLPDPDKRFEVREVGVNTLPQLVLPPDEYLHWCQRHSFLRNAERFLQCLGAYAGDVLTAYAIALRHAPNTGLLDLRSKEADLAPGYELLRWITEHNYRPPFDASYVSNGSYSHRVLSAAGFTERRHFSTLSRDLRAAA